MLSKCVTRPDKHDFRVIHRTLCLFWRLVWAETAKEWLGGKFCSEETFRIKHSDRRSKTWCVPHRCTAAALFKDVQKWPFVPSPSPTLPEWKHEFTQVRKTNLIGRYPAGRIFNVWGGTLSVSKELDWMLSSTKTGSWTTAFNQVKALSAALGTFSAY